MSDDTSQTEQPKCDEDTAVIEPLDDPATVKKALQEAIQEKHEALDSLEAATQMAAEHLAGWHSANKTIDDMKKEMERQQKSLEAFKRRSELAAVQKLDSLIYAVDEFLSTSPTPPADIREHDWVAGVQMLQRKLEAALVQRIDADSVVVALDAERLLAFEELAEEIAAAKEAEAPIALAVEAIAPAPGEPFDGVLHQAIGIDSSGAQDSGSVAQLLRRGYRVGDFVLREALVMVAG